MIEISQRLANLSPAQKKLLDDRLQKKPSVAEPIAIVGMSCRFAGASSVDEFWNVIRQGIDATSEIPPSRWNIDDFFDPTGELNGKMSVRWGGFIKDVDQFDPQFFGIAPREARKMDPQQRLLLECAWEAFEYAGLAPESMSGSSTGVFIGIGGTDYSKCPVQFTDYYEQIDAHTGTGNALSIAANRISYILDLKGPSMAIDTACSSGLLGVHLAVQALRNRDCDAALAGGVNTILSPETTIAFSRAKMLSADGHCRPFDAGANGYVRGEGCGIVMLKRLTDAVANGDNVLAVLRATATNQDGRTSGITAPNGRAQQIVIRAALAQAGLTPERISYIEAHGTGTPLGDPIEVQALTELFRQRSPQDGPIHMTSVKANIGHTETVSGVAGLIKVVLLMQHGVIPPQTHFKTLNPNIHLEGSRLHIPTEPTEWTQGNGGSRVAGVSSFGFGGANVHVLVEEAAPAKFEPPAEDRPLHVLALSAKSDAALDQQVDHLASYLEKHPETRVADLCFTENTGRSHFNHRLTLLTDNTDQLLGQLGALKEKKPVAGSKRAQVKIIGRPKVAFVFTGQGSQYVGMGRQLFETQPVFRKTLQQCDEILTNLLDESLLAVLYPEPGRNSPLDETAFTQPALFSLEYSLATLWRSWGIEPSVVLGHSVGEYVAACVSGVFSLDDGLKLIADRARLMQQLPQNGLMAVLFAPGGRVAEFLKSKGCEDNVSIAAFNGPENTVISGLAEVVRELVAELTAQGVGSQMLTVSHAFHSPLMEPMLDEFERLAGEVTFNKPKIPLVANLTAEVVTEARFDAKYWRNHIRNAVRFSEGMQLLAEAGPHAILEVGPTAALLGMGRRCLPKLDVAWIPSLRKGQDDLRTVIGSLTDLHLLGVKVNWAGFDQPWPRRRLVLPSYPFERTRQWYGEESTKQRVNFGSGGAAISRGPAVHPLLGCTIPSALEDTIYEVPLSSRSPAYLVDHQVQGSPVVPAAAYIEQGLAVAELVFGPGTHAVENVSIQAAMFLPENASRVVQITVSPELGGECSFETYSIPADAEQNASGKKPRWTMHACGRLRHGDISASRRASAPGEASGETAPGADAHRLAELTIDLEEVRARSVDVSERDEFYKRIAERGLAYGPAFQVLSNLRRTRTDALAEVQLAPSVVQELKHYRLHPALGDACFQSMAGAVPLEADGSYSPYTYLPVGVRRVVKHGELTEKMFTYAVRTSEDDRPSPEVVEGNVYLLDEHGRVLVELNGVRVQRVGRAAGGRSADVREWLYRIDWQAQPLSAESKTMAGNWLIFGDTSGVGRELAAKLESGGAKCVVVNSDALDPLAAEGYQRLLAESFGDKPNLTGIVHLWSLDVPSLEVDSEAALDEARRLGTGSILRLIQQIVRTSFAKPPALWLATKGAQPVGEAGVSDVASAAVWGLGRVAAMEMAELKCRLVDLDPSVSATDVAGNLASEIGSGADEDQIAYRAGQRFVARLAAAPEAISSSDGSGTMSSGVPRGGPFRLRLGTAGSFDSLKFEAFSRPQPGKGQIEVAVRAAGLNFSDVLKAMGLYPGIKDAIVPLGIECSGVVTALGEGVTRFQVGDEVMGVAPYSFASHALTADYAMVHKPKQIDDEEACTIPITYLTAYYGLCHLARIRKGERVLIHAGAGGVGLAAIQICQQIGCEIFTTAGSDIKRDYLASLGIPADHVLSSRSLDFAEEILKLTNREGIDVVLNSLPGDAITKSLQILRAYGRFLEIGKTDIYSNRMIGLLPFQDNLSYFAIDLDRMLRQRPEYIQELYAEVMPHFESAVYQPLALTRFPIEDTIGAFRYMAQRKNIGKVVVSVSDGDTTLARRASEGSASTPPAKPEKTVRADATYLITGGLGALGLQVADWLAKQGAKHLVLLGRRTPAGEAAEAVAKLAAAGVRVAAVQGDAAERPSLDAALAQIPAGFPPLRGVMHAAGVLDDGVLYDMSLARLDKAMRPKVQGGWNLHAATLGLKEPLDFFVLFSSVACVLGSPGQGNYSAANAFLDGLAAYRRSRGLPATSINWGPWAGSGMAATGDVSEQIKSKGMALIPSDQGLKLLGEILNSNSKSAPTNVAVMDVRWKEMQRLLSKRKPPLVRNFELEADETAGPDTSKVDHVFRKELLAADTDQRKAKLTVYFQNELARIMGIEASTLNVEQPLNSIGLDSLMAMELKNNLEAKLAFSLPMQKFLEGPSVTSLAASAAELLVADEVEQVAEATAVGGNGKNGNGKNGKNGKTEVWSPIVALQSLGTKPPLFCIHPVGGDVRCYFEVARNIKDRPVIALRARGIDSAEPAHDSIVAMAADYLPAIRQRQPSGPYFLAGWSTGGIFAYELARQMREQNLEVAKLVLIDTPLPSIFEGVDMTDDAKFLFDLVNFSNHFAGAAMNVSYEELKALDPEARFQLALAEAKRHGVVPQDVSTNHIRRLVDVCKAHSKAIMNYTPAALDIVPEFLRPADTSKLGAASGKSLSDDLGWRSVLGEKVNFHHTPGDHFSMLTGDQAAKLAQLLGSRLG